MKEIIRKKIVEGIEKSIKSKENLLRLRKNLEELEETEEIKKYLTLKARIRNLEHLVDCSTLESILMYDFDSILFWNKDKCTHDVWLYTGSYKIEELKNYGYEYSLLDNEYNREFNHNRYICLDCLEKVNIYDWQNFEKEHRIIKAYPALNHEELRKEYFKLAYTHTAEEAIRILEEKYNNRNVKKLTK